MILIRFRTLSTRVCCQELDDRLDGSGDCKYNGREAEKPIRDGGCRRACGGLGVALMCGYGPPEEELDTGAASGIGRATAERCAQEGMRIVLADVEEPAPTQTESEMKAAGAQVLAVVTDVSQAEPFDILTHPEFRPVVQARMEAIVGGQELRPLAALMAVLGG